MSILHGQTARTYLGGYDLSPDVAAVAMALKRDLAAYAIQDSTYGYHQVRGHSDSEITLETYLDDETWDRIIDMRDNGTTPQLLVPFKDSGVSDSFVPQQGMAFYAVTIASAEAKAVSTDINRVTLVLRDNGVALIPPSPTVIAMAKYDATGSGAWQYTKAADGLAATASGCRCYLQCFTSPAGGNWSFKVQDSTASGSGFGDLASFVTPAAIGSAYVATTGAVKRYVRFALQGDNLATCSATMQFHRIPD